MGEDIVFPRRAINAISEILLAAYHVGTQQTDFTDMASVTVYVRRR